MQTLQKLSDNLVSSFLNKFAVTDLPSVEFVEDMESTLDQVGKIGDDIKDVRDLVEGNVAPEGVKVTDEIILQKITNITQEIKNKQNEITKSEIDEATNNNINNENKKNAVKDVTDNVMKNDGC